MIPVHEGVIIAFVQTFIEGSDDQCRLVPDDLTEAGVDAMLTVISARIPAGGPAAARRVADVG